MGYQDDEPGEENVYSEEAREEAVEDDEISAEEEGFMKGYDEADEEEPDEDTEESEESEEPGDEETEEL